MKIKFSIEEMMESRVHLGHKYNKMNPAMGDYVYGTRSGISVIDLRHTYVLMEKALSFLYKIAKEGGRILFVGTKEDAAPIIQGVADATGQYYVINKWLGGMLTNWSTIKNSIKRIDIIESNLDSTIYTKKEKIKLSKIFEKSMKNLGGVRKMGDLPKVLVVVDIKREAVAVQEANKMGIPVVALVDTNVNPKSIIFPIPANDDGPSSISYILKNIEDAILQGLSDGVSEIKKRSRNDDDDDMKKEFQNIIKVAKEDTPVNEGV